MKLLVQKTNETKINIIKIELTSSDFENDINTYVIKENETPIIYFTDTEKSYLINNIEFKLKRINSEAILKISESDLISLSSTNNLTVNLTKSEVNDLKNTNSLIPGLNYTITDADTPLYGGTEVTLTAITPSELSLHGSGKFYTPKYDLTVPGYNIWTTYMEGTFSNIVGSFTPGEMITDQNGAEAIYLAEGFLNYVSGDWSLAVNVFGASGAADVSGFVLPSYTIGQIVHWGGKSWTNNNGNIGASVDKYTLDAEWTEIPFNETDYNVYIDEIQYDFENDLIISRKDRGGNEVSFSAESLFELQDNYGLNNPIKDFQWGCYSNISYGRFIYGNKVIDSYLESLNCLGNIYLNILNQYSSINSNILSRYSTINANILNQSIISSNTLIQSNIGVNTLRQSDISVNTLNKNNNIITNILNFSFINSNILNQNSYIYYNTLNVGAKIESNDLSNSYIQTNTLEEDSEISSNILKESNIYSNHSSVESYITFNTLQRNSTISENNLDTRANITNNTFDNLVGIRYNNLDGLSDIKEMTLDASQQIIYCNISNNSNFKFTNLLGNIQYCSVNNFNLLNVLLDASGATHLGANYSKQLFDNSANVPRLQYVNELDVTVITDVNS